MSWLFNIFDLLFKPLYTDPEDPWIRIRNTGSISDIVKSSSFCFA